VIVPLVLTLPFSFSASPRRCSSKTSGGGAFTYRIPGGVTIGSRNHAKILPNSPYKNAEGAVFQAWRPGHWSSWMFEVDSHATTQVTNH